MFADSIAVASLSFLGNLPVTHSGIVTVSKLQLSLLGHPRPKADRIQKQLTDTSGKPKQKECEC